VSPSPPPPSDHLLHSLAHLLMYFVHLNLQQIEHDVVTRSAPAPLPSPVASLIIVWTRITAAIKHSSSPCPPEGHRGLAVVQGSSERRRRPPPVRRSPATTGTLDLNGELSLSFNPNRPIKIHWI
jgi:hypothetical protein